MIVTENVWSVSYSVAVRVSSSIVGPIVTSGWISFVPCVTGGLMVDGLGRIVEEVVVKDLDVHGAIQNHPLIIRQNIILDDAHV